MQEVVSSLRILLTADSFERRTRLCVGILALLPAATLLLDLYLFDFQYVSVFAALFLLCGGSWVLGELVGSLGEQKQELLRLRWGGRPATLLLRHRDGTVTASIKHAWHQKYAARLNVPFPTAAEERRQPTEADATYVQAARWSEIQTEDRAKFRTLWQCRTQYEFFLNGFALRGIGLTIAIVCAVWACMKNGGVTFGGHPQWEVAASVSLRPGSAAVLAVSTLTASAWLFWFTEDRVRANARSYDRRLLEIGGEPDFTTPVPVSPSAERTAHAKPESAPQSSCT